jgi:hypothetical protein
MNASDTCEIYLSRVFKEYLGLIKTTTNEWIKRKSFGFSSKTILSRNEELLEELNLPKKSLFGFELEMLIQLK